MDLQCCCHSVIAELIESHLWLTYGSKKISKQIEYVSDNATVNVSCQIGNETRMPWPVAALHNALHGFCNCTLSPYGLKDSQSFWGLNTETHFDLETWCRIFVLHTSCEGVRGNAKLFCVVPGVGHNLMPLCSRLFGWLFFWTKTKRARCVFYLMLYYGLCKLRLCYYMCGVFLRVINTSISEHLLWCLITFVLMEAQNYCQPCLWLWTKDFVQAVSRGWIREGRHDSVWNKATGTILNMF